MALKPINEVANATEARDLAIDYSNADKDGLGYGDLAEHQEYFEALAEKFPELREEFEENAII